MILATKQFFERLVKGIGDTTAMCFKEGVKADKEIKRDLEAVRDALWEIRKTLYQIEKTLDWAAQQPNDTLDKYGAAVISDELKPKPTTISAFKWRLKEKPRAYIMLKDFALKLGFKHSGGLGAIWCEEHQIYYYQEQKGCPVYVDLAAANAYLWRKQHNKEK